LACSDPLNGTEYGKLPHQVDDLQLTFLLRKRSVMPVILKTSQGDITLELDSEAAPVTVENFLKYARDGHYNGTIFHRVIKGFMIQGGGFSSDMKQKSTRASIKNESSNGLSNVKYTIAMARTSVPDSATSQFFINTKDNLFLDRANAQDGVGYCVFGKVTSGNEVIDAIEGVDTTRRAGHTDVPVDAVEIQSVEVSE
jgi:peptidyl-prolyl cis-trans isomerase B (cyclophilin B)